MEIEKLFVVLGKGVVEETFDVDRFMELYENNKKWLHQLKNCLKVRKGTVIGMRSFQSRSLVDVWEVFLSYSVRIFVVKQEYSVAEMQYLQEHSFIYSFLELTSSNFEKYLSVACFRGIMLPMHNSDEVFQMVNLWKDKVSVMIPCMEDAVKDIYLFFQDLCEKENVIWKIEDCSWGIIEQNRTIQMHFF